MSVQDNTFISPGPFATDKDYQSFIITSVLGQAKLENMPYNFRMRPSFTPEGRLIISGMYAGGPPFNPMTPRHHLLAAIEGYLKGPANPARNTEFEEAQIRILIEELRARLG